MRTKKITKHQRLALKLCEQLPPDIDEAIAVLLALTELVERYVKPSPELSVH